MTIHAFYEPLAGLFTDAECDALLKTRASLPAIKDRFSDLLVTPVPPKAHWSLYEKIFKVFAEANTCAWRLSLDGFVSLQFLEYTLGCSYPWHADVLMPVVNDIGRGEARLRVFKLAASILLSPAENFEGGELELMLGSLVGPNGSLGEPTLVAPLHKRGDAVLFPAYVLHQIRPVTSGTRVVLVARLGGPAFQ